MDPKVIIILISYTTPVFSGLICTILLLSNISYLNNKTERKISFLLIAYYIAIMVVWASTAMYIFVPEYFVYVNSLMYLGYLLVQVFFYHYVFLVTDTENTKFPWGHYVLPLLIFITLTIWMFFVPYDVQYEIAASRNEQKNDYTIFTYFTTSRLFVRFLFGVVYTVLGIICLFRYRKAVIDFSSNEEKSAMSWLRTYFILTVLLNFAPLLSMIFSRARLADSYIALYPGIILFFQHAILCYNTLTNKYVLVSETNTEPNQNRNASRLSRDDFERYMSTQKPYLNPDLKITDITTRLYTNRTYLSAFINQTYGMNFNRYINECRLCELENLLDNSPEEKQINLHLIQEAGFGSYDSYRRAKKSRELV